MSFLERIKKIVADHLSVSEDSVTESSKFVDDLGADSLDQVELVMAMEEEFGVQIPDSVAAEMATIGDALRYVKEHADKTDNAASAKEKVVSE